MQIVVILAPAFDRLVFILHLFLDTRYPLDREYHPTTRTNTNWRNVKLSSAKTPGMCRGTFGRASSHKFRPQKNTQTIAMLPGSFSSVQWYAFADSRTATRLSLLRLDLILFSRLLLHASMLHLLASSFQ